MGLAARELPQIISSSDLKENSSIFQPHLYPVHLQCLCDEHSLEIQLVLGKKTKKFPSLVMENVLFWEF